MAGQGATGARQGRVAEPLGSGRAGWRSHWEERTMGGEPPAGSGRDSTPYTVHRTPVGPGGAEWTFPRGPLASLDTFTSLVTSRQLRPYQSEVGRAILESLQAGRGDTITVMFARQMGKNELSAQLEAYLLNLFQLRGGTIVKAAPTFKPQIINSQKRLHTILENPLNCNYYQTSHGYITSLGRANVMFFSAEKGANVVGATADILLEIDEAQDVDEEKYARDFRPMAGTTNAPAVLYGTAATEDTLLAHQRAVNLDLERSGDRRLHFEYPWRFLAAHNPAYAAFVAGEIRRLGADHPVIRTQYELVPVSRDGRYLSAAQLGLLAGKHDPELAPAGSAVYIAGLDVGGQDEEAPDEATRRKHPKRDSTVLTIGRVTFREDDLPFLEVVHHEWWTGRNHRDQYLAVLAQVEHWGIRRLAVDATGLGAGLASWLEARLGSDRVISFHFTRPGKSELAFDTLAMVNTGRLKMHGDTENENAKEFWQQMRTAKYEMLSSETMTCYVNSSDGHDDFLMSLLLLCHAAGKVRTGPAYSTVVQPVRIYGDEGWY